MYIGITIGLIGFLAIVIVIAIAISIIASGSELCDCNLTDSELRVKSLLIANSHKGIDVVNGTL